ncbi:sulfate/molybdate ABC transporter ATP-binding protein [Granulicoccus sp. GXG6511]|uniref:sulfate/molybdate ABC transporter ATP-binding protein n=1 Tax=Granulicoccus sp. GXG6511 TaxID=3381351 RepID=UPI003D7DB5DF
MPEPGPPGSPLAHALTVAATVERRGVQLAFSARRGSTTALIGPNGSGKSTAIQLLAGALQPDSGGITIDGTRVADARSLVPAHRRRIGYLEQRPLLFPHLSVLDNVAFGPRARGVRRDVARARARFELTAVGAEHLADRRPRQLSGGQAQRVAMARALAIDPDVVLLDEPFAALDAASTPDLRRLLRERLEGVTTLLVTHDLLDVLALAEGLVVLEAGRVVAAGGLDEVLTAPPTGFVADFVGVNLLHGTAVDATSLRLDHGPVLVGIGEIKPGEEARATVAPDAISLHRTAPGGSPRNTLDAEVVALDSRGPVVGVTVHAGAQALRVDLTAAAVAELGLVPGMRLVAVVKATQVRLHRSAPHQTVSDPRARPAGR